MKMQAVLHEQMLLVFLFLFCLMFVFTQTCYRNEMCVLTAGVHGALDFHTEAD